MTKIIRPEPISREIILDPTKVIMSKTDSKGVILYANEYFMDICGYLEYELMGQQHNAIRHPDMPRIIFKMLWERLFKGENIHAIVKNLAKDGRYYWVVTNFETKFDENGNVIAHYSRRKAAPEKVVWEIEKIYKVLLKLEENDKTMALAGNYLVGLLEDKEMTYDEFILSLLETTEEQLQSYFINPELNLNIKTTPEPVVEDDISEEIVEEQKENKRGFFSRFFGK